MSVTTPTGARREGTAHDLIDRALGDLPEYRRFRRGELSRTDYARWLGEAGPRPEEVGLNEDQLNLSTRFPVDDRASVAAALEEIAGLGALPRARYPEHEFDELWRQVRTRFAHRGLTTYIFPEEARLLFAVAHLLAPAVTVFSGSYYGYWAVWALPGIMKAGGRAVLVDIDPRVCALARANLAALGMGGHAEVVTHDAITFGASLTESGTRVDMVVLDAEGPKQGGPEELRDKAIYAPIMAATTPALRPGGLLVAHNMLLENLTENAYFAGRIENNRRQYARFHAHLDDHYDVRYVLPTSEGVGVYRRREGR